MAKYLRVTYVKSSIGNLQQHKDTIKGLGFHKLGETRDIVDNPAMRGMVQSVIHLVKVEEVDGDTSATASNGKAPASGGTK